MTSDARSSFWIPVCPSKCALVIGLPVEREDFYQQMHQPEHDFAKFVLENLGGHASLAWQEYERLARLVQYVCIEVERLGVTVVQKAGLAELRTLFTSGMRAVTLVSHWRMLTIQGIDILDPHKLLGVLDSKQTAGPILEALHAAWHDSLNWYPLSSAIEEMPAERLRKALADRLCGYVKAANTFYLRRSDREGEADPRWKELTRTGLERVLDETLLNRGRFVELYDGLHTLSELIESIPQAFDGVLDLSICHSAFAFETIKQQRPECLMVVNRFPATLEFRMVRYKLLVELLAETPRPFIPLAAKVHGELGEAYEGSEGCT